MNPLRHAIATFVCATALLLPAPPASAAEAARPSFEAHSELFELVGRIRDGRLALTLDDWASNEPISGARIEVDLAGQTLVAEPLADGTYTLDATPFARAATYPLTITVTAGEQSDLLATDLVVGDSAATGAIVAGIGIREIGIAATLALLAAVVAVRLSRRKGEPA
ncbi:hypothetical protein [Accumulibacter sp.]|uniref:hypothetical protein n=1 Tax=Accumulibacter sp. TaxID=2053492 RepID=UPI0025D46356|nr:hypothetical protein [Accumulibacter sp.]MCM8611986.1 hypothetical protein [Accumulibacter sp.]MCM8635846.1 hypothetical protein [Accumulibacter sp.]MCM8641928.1 hypothetical protein [Accumulibacter sp.]